VITALAIMEKQPFKPGQEGETYTITKNDIANLNAYISEGGSVLPIRVGMKLTQYQAMQRMLIASDNIIADILGKRIFGSTKAYILYARDMLKRMGLNRTVVADASGFSPATVSTPSELVAIGIAALNNPVIAKIVAQQQVQLPVAGIINEFHEFLRVCHRRTGSFFNLFQCHKIACLPVLSVTGPRIFITTAGCGIGLHIGLSVFPAFYTSKYPVVPVRFVAWGAGGWRKAVNLISNIHKSYNLNNTTKRVVYINARPTKLTRNFVGRASKGGRMVIKYSSAFCRLLHPCRYNHPILYRRYILCL